jgi:hypothetical protein
MELGCDQAALVADKGILVIEKFVSLLTAGSSQGKRRRDARAIAFSTRTDPFGFL